MQTCVLIELETDGLGLRYAREPGVPIGARQTLDARRRMVPSHSEHPGRSSVGAKASVVLVRDHGF